MGLGSTAKKLQTVADQAEKLYGKVNEMREQITEMRATVDETGDRVAELDEKVERQQAIIEALAEEQGIDVEAVTGDSLPEDVTAVGDGSVAPPADDGDGQATGDAN